MTDSLKLSEMQRTSIEFERQRHLANWFIKSSPHMANPQSQQQQQPQLHPLQSSSSSQQQQSSLNPNGSINNINKNLTNNTNNDLTEINLTKKSIENTNDTLSTILINNTLKNSTEINGTINTNINSTNNEINNPIYDSINDSQNIDNINNTSCNNNIDKPSSTGGIKNGTITGNPLYFLVSSNGQKHRQQSPPPPQQQQQQQQQQQHAINGSGNLGLSRSQIFNSQSNLPLQLVASAQQPQEGRKPKLRRFNSHDTSPNMFSVADFENARLARRNEIEMKQRQQQRKMNSLSSGGDCSTGDSKGSKYSNDSQNEPLSADVFLDRYSLPRVVRVTHKPKFSHETLQSSSSNGSTQSSSASLSQNMNSKNILNNNNNNCDLTKQNGEIFLLYRHLKQRNNYHGFNSKTGLHNRKKGVIIPEEYPGYFSLINDKGLSTATQYTSLIQLVRERVYKFISVDSLSAFTESAPATSSSNDVFLPASSNSRPHYIKSTARAGQVFRLLAVFEDGKETNNKTALTAMNSSGREKEKGRYAQLLNENRQIIYVSLSTKGKFYEIEQSIPQILQKSYEQQNLKTVKKKLNPDCVHRISILVTADQSLPLNLKFISGPSGSNNHPTIPENLTITKVSTENVIVACPIEDFDTTLLQSSFQLRKLNVAPDIYFMKCFLGFENEKRMLANPNVQNLLKFCQFNCDPFLKLVTTEPLQRSPMERSKTRVDSLKILKPLNFPKLLRREKSTIAHEKEDSIIFLSKNDLANLEAKEMEPNRISDKMKVFQSTKKKWFRKGETQKSMTSIDIDVQAKRMSMQRYNDMSKLLQERFGGEVLRASDDGPMSQVETQPKRLPIQKSLSLQEVDFKQPDLLPNTNVAHCSSLGKSTGANEKIINHNKIEDDIYVMTDISANNDLTENVTKETFVEDDEIQEATEEDNPNGETKPQQSFISEKLCNEFLVKTRQYSRSSSSLHQLLHFAVPQKMNVVETKKSNGQQQQSKITDNQAKIDFILGGDEHIANDQKSQEPTIIDDLPYSSVRDSLLVSQDLSIAPSTIGELGNNEKLNENLNDSRENIYAEICHFGGNYNVSTIQTNNDCIEQDTKQTGSAISRIQINGNNDDVVLISGSNTLPNHLNGNGIDDGANNINNVDNIYNTLK